MPSLKEGGSMKYLQGASDASWASDKRFEQPRLYPMPLWERVHNDTECSSQSLCGRARRAFPQMSTAQYKCSLQARLLFPRDGG